MEKNIGNVNYKIHKIYKIYGASEMGQIINIKSKKIINHDNETPIIKLEKTFATAPKKYRVDAFVWECFNDLIIRGYYLKHINDDENDNRISNLKLEKIKKSNIKWIDREYKCCKCGKVTTNNKKYYHNRVCPYSDNPFTEDEIRVKRNGDIVWKRQRTTCVRCGGEYTNNYKYQHEKRCSNYKRE